MSSAHGHLGRLLRLPLRFVSPERPRRVLSGPLRGALWIPAAATHGCWLGVYERENQRAFVRLLRPGMTVYDIGANAGFFSLLAARLCGPGGSVVAFEPFRRNLEYLRRHLELNRAETVTVVEAAVADSAGEGFLSAATASPATAALAPQGVPVMVVDLDGVIRARDLRRPELLKIDVEGAESAVLRGANALLRTAHPAILLSSHGWRQHEACVSYLREHGYEVREKRDGNADGNYESLATWRGR